MSVLTCEEFARLTDDADDRLLSAIHYAMGAASTCWESMDGTGVFQPDRAAQISRDLAEWIRANYQLSPAPPGL